jgi:hypothetical protein
MGFWGKLGKGLLKAAPIAAAFIPGIGPLAAMGIGAATGAASKKLSGGSWKQSLGAGAMGAATGAMGAAGKGVLGAARGLAPSASKLTNIMRGVGKAGNAMRMMGGQQPLPGKQKAASPNNFRQPLGGNQMMPRSNNPWANVKF